MCWVQGEWVTVATSPFRRQTWFRRRLVLRGFIVLAALGLLILLTTATVSTPLGMRVAGLFGGLVNGIRRNPGATALLTFGSVASLWLVVALLTAGQEWIAAKRR
jgi:hypothetical protein